MDNLMSKSKKELCTMLVEVQQENKTLKLVNSFIKNMTRRLEYLERIQNLSQQYERRSPIEITGIPLDIPSKQIENEVLKIYKAADITIHGKSLDHFDIQAAHRKGKKGTIIVKFFNRKFAYEGLVNGKRLKGKNIYGEDTKVFINDSFCPEFGFLNFLIRKEAKHNRDIKYKIKNGVNQIKMPNSVNFVEIAHKHYRIKTGIQIPDYELDTEFMCSS